MQMSETMDFTTTRAEALELLCKNWPLKAATEVIPLQQACGRVTAKPLHSQNTLPVYRVSQFDGIAVRFSAFENGLPDTSGWVEGVDYVRADTGDDFPDAFDTIVAVEDFFYNDKGHICFYDTIDYERGDCIRAAGSVVREGDVIADAHVRLTPEHLAMLALGGIYQVEVIRKPKVIYIPTGSELINAGIKPERGQNIEANSLMVSSYLTQWGADPFCYPIVKDKPAELEQTLKNALAAGDIVLINGGSSKGAEDFNTELLHKNASLYRHGIRVVPGRPVTIAIIDGKPVINLPGPTLATFLAMDWCVFGLVHHYFGLPAPIRPKLKVRLVKPIQKNPEVEMYLRFSLKKWEGIYWATQIGRDKNLPDTLLKADAIYVAPIGVAGYEAGDEVEVELLCGLESLR
jgi:molybdopterin molybdotransferase/putative molybdopterin biosynthesis protein